MWVLHGTNVPLGDYAFIKLTRGKVCIVDYEAYEWLMQWTWFARKSSSRFYAVRKVRVNGKESIIRMHRLIAQTPDNQVCHHVNGNCLDNRIENLENMRRGLHDVQWWYGPKL